MLDPYLFPPKLSCSNLVSFESRYGTCLSVAVYPLALANAPTTLPRASRPELIAIPSFARSPTALVRFSLSDPAKSTKLNFETVIWKSPSVDDEGMNRCWRRERAKIACERDDVLFMSVAFVCRYSRPFKSSLL